MSNINQKPQYTSVLGEGSPLKDRQLNLFESSNHYIAECESFHNSIIIQDNSESYHNSGDGQVDAQSQDETNYLAPYHRLEWQQSGINDDIINLNIVTLNGDDASEAILYGLDCDRTNSGSLSLGYKKRYSHLELGGWFCSGENGVDRYWGCFKPDHPYTDPQKGKAIKYEHPINTPTGIFKLKVSRNIGEQIAGKHGLAEAYIAHYQDASKPSKSSEDKEFWAWALEKNLPIIITEGVKKAGALLSSGYLAIALPGIFSGYRTKDNVKTLIPPLLDLATKGREFIFAFDSDSKPATRRNVEIALFNYSLLLKKQGCTVSRITWDSSTKGIDDYIIAHGENALDTLIEKREMIKEAPFELSKVNQVVNAKYLSEVISIGDIANNLIVIKSRQGTGKTKAIADFVKERIEEFRPSIYIAPTENLARDFGKKSGLPYRLDAKGKALGYCLVLDSFHDKNNGFSVDQWNTDNFPVIIIDEFEQLWQHLFWADTDIKKHRNKVYFTLRKALALAFKYSKIIIPDADASDYGIQFLKDLLIAEIGESEAEKLFNPWVIQNNYQEGNLTIERYPSQDELLLELKESFKAGETILIQTTSQKAGSSFSSKNLERLALRHYAPNEVVRIDRETVGEKGHLAQAIMADFGLVERLGKKVVIITPVGLTGWSLEVFNYFAKNFVFGGKKGHISPNSMIQFMWRLRDFNVIRKVAFPDFSDLGVGSGSGSKKQLALDESHKQNNNMNLLRLTCLDELGNQITDDTLSNAWAKFGARYNRYQSNYGDVVIDLLRRQNATIIEINKETDEDELMASIQERKEIKKESIKIEVKDILDAEDIDDQTARFIECKKQKTRDEQLSEIKHNYKRMYGQNLTPKIVECQVRSQSAYSQLKTLYYATLGKEFRQGKQEKDITFLVEQNQDCGVLQSDINKTIKEYRYKLIELLIDQLGLGEIRNDSPILQQIVTNLMPHARNIKLNAGVTLPIDAKNPVTVINRLLAICGLRLKMNRREMVNGNRYRWYQIESNLKPLSLADIQGQLSDWLLSDLQKMELPESEVI